MQTTQKRELSMRKVSLFIGVTLIIMAIASGIAYGYLHPTIFQADSQTFSPERLQPTLTLLRFEILLWLVVIVTDIIVAWALHLYMRQFHENLSLLAAWLRLLYTATLAMSIGYLLQISVSLESVATQSNANLDALLPSIAAGERAFSLVWGFGLIIFGLHLLVLAYVALKATPIHKAIGYLLFLAVASYLVIHTLTLLGPNMTALASQLEGFLAVPMALGELSLVLWFIFKKGAALKVQPALNAA